MIPRIRVFAGPNGSGKSTLAEWLSKDYSVNLYQYINADQMFSEIDRTLMLACPLPTCAVVTVVAFLFLAECPKHGEEI